MRNLMLDIIQIRYLIELMVVLVLKEIEFYVSEVKILNKYTFKNGCRISIC